MIPFCLQFADSWSATINQSAAARREISSSSTDSVAVGDNSSSPMKSVRSVVESLTSLILSSSRDASLGKQQVLYSLFISSLCCFRVALPRIYVDGLRSFGYQFFFFFSIQVEMYLVACTWLKEQRIFTQNVFLVDAQTILEVIKDH